MIGLCSVISADQSMQGLWESDLNDLGYCVSWHLDLVSFRYTYKRLYPDILLIDLDCVSLDGIGIIYALQRSFGRRKMGGNKIQFRDNPFVYGLSKHHDFAVFPFVNKFIFSPREIAPSRFHCQSSRNYLRNLVLDL